MYAYKYQSVADLCANHANLAEYIAELENREKNLLSILYLIASANTPVFDSDDAINFKKQVDILLAPWIKETTKKSN